MKVIRSVLLFCLLSSGFYVYSFGASFDCAKAVSKVEHLICADKELSALDTTLSKLYNAVKTNQSSLVKEQKQWILKQRNKCVSAVCLKNTYKARIQALESIECAVKEQALLGSWVRVQGDTTFEEMNFSIIDGEHSFLSWIHHRPEMGGVWEIKKCILHIHDPNQSAVLSFDLKIKKLEKGKLYLFDTDVKSNLVYQFYP